MPTLNTPIEEIPKISRKYHAPLKRLGIRTVRDLIFHFPFRHEDYSNIASITELENGKTFTIEAEILKCEAIRTWKKRMKLTSCTLSDGDSTIRAVWFNQPFLARNFHSGKSIRISGKVSIDKSGLYFANPSWEAASRSATNTAGLVPIYPETEGITSKWIRWQIKELESLVKSMEDPIPSEILGKLNLPDISKSIKWIHFPENEKQFIIAQKRFAFQEMLILQLTSLLAKMNWDKEKSVGIETNKEALQNLISSLPFALTNSQKKAAERILEDMKKDRSMNRLLNGDVGSGKTVVAAIASFSTSKSNFQSALMAPTEVLARQHFESFEKILSTLGITVGLLTNSYQLISNKNGSKKVPREDLLKSLRSGEIDVLIGTHAIIQKGIRFKNLVLIMVDEQHRFGVAQRAYLQQEISEINDGLKGKIPHFLTMTATPIPRTLTLSIFGDLDLSVLSEMPKNRKTIKTQAVPAKERKNTYDFVRTQISEGRQVFIIFPLVEESKALSEVKAATAEHKKLSENIFPDLSLGLLHGKLKAKEKEEVMNDFKNGKYDILVATSVVEVGIDVPNATVIIIEDADRFGLSQLHQFRGRVGRGKHQSYCFLFSKNSSSNKRLKAMEKFSSGFDIAEKDLELRGPGQFLGRVQSGLPDIAMSSITNIKLIEISRNIAEDILKKDPKIENHPLLKGLLAKFNEKIHME